MKRPLLAAKADLSKLHFPVMTSPKFDGIRCLLTSQGAMSRTGKLLPNLYLQKQLNLNTPFDGEIMMYNKDKKPADFNTIQSAVMSVDGEFDFVYEIFDYVPVNSITNINYDLRYRHLTTLKLPNFSNIVEQTFCNNLDEVSEQIRLHLENGFEGTMIRNPFSKYKFGRSTINDGTLLKYKEFQDDEALIIDVQELFHNNNLPEKDIFELIKRSSKQENLVRSGMLGSFIVKYKNVTFQIGTGFTEEQRHHFWKFKPIGETVTFRYQSLSPTGVPRFPSFLRFRKDDI